ESVWQKRADPPASWDAGSRQAHSRTWRELGRGPRKAWPYRRDHSSAKPGYLSAERWARTFAYLELARGNEGPLECADLFEHTAQAAGRHPQRSGVGQNRQCAPHGLQPTRRFAQVGRRRNPVWREKGRCPEAIANAPEE